MIPVHNLNDTIELVFLPNFCVGKNLSYQRVRAVFTSLNFDKNPALYRTVLIAKRYRQFLRSGFLSVRRKSRREYLSRPRVKLSARG